MPDDEDQSVSSSGSDDAVMDCGHARKWSLTNPCWCLSPSDVGLRACHGRAFVFDPISSDEEYSAGAGSAAVCAGSVHVEADVKDDLASCPRPTHRAPVAECFESEAQWRFEGEIFGQREPRLSLASAHSPSPVERPEEQGPIISDRWATC